MSDLGFKSVTHVADNGARVEVATVTHEGHEFTNLGAVIDTERGIIVGYPRKLTEHGGNCGRPTYELRTWEGKHIAPLRLVRSYKGGFAGYMPQQLMYAWSMTYEGRVYSGRNGGMWGAESLLRMRAGRKVSP